MLRNLWGISSKLSDKDLKIQIVQGCILSHIDYCNALYVNLPKKQTNKLQRLIKSSVRFVFNLRLSNRISITEYTKQCHFLPVEARINFKTCMLVFKCINGNAPVYLKELLQFKQTLQSLRISNDKLLLQIPPLSTVKTKYKERKFSFAAPTLWNMLPFEIRTSQSMIEFRRKLKTFFFQKCYNT